MAGELNLRAERRTPACFNRKFLTLEFMVKAARILRGAGLSRAGCQNDSDAQLSGKITADISRMYLYSIAINNIYQHFILTAEVRTLHLHPIEMR